MKLLINGVAFMQDTDDCSIPIHYFLPSRLTHWGRVKHICVDNLTTIGSDDGLSPGRHQVIIWTSAGILLMEPLGTNSNEIVIRVHTFSFQNIHLKYAKCRLFPFCRGINALKVLWEFLLVDCSSCFPTTNLHDKTEVFYQAFHIKTRV